mmetsp:Transcript_7452/g.12629  ORF Transcript_7452/g.12629 Transcript_7452/m.12629 type:complete len:215 (-) Transcript_7452:187-831(-)|eukprot:CAMPEP_0119313248 /NCGR_PEP_ID=MMETSP1333-20130426/28481_1 /TAXON_ID=418940 /ORGANISM="Scyphosphaera apsteinii, Strain RCC1455" /LENGTH=214 /DNA_ID=CAMNT_0007318045 /DNA_START=151 /DNA_END=795 /DNA_ORIENTATION=-
MVLSAFEGVLVACAGINAVLGYSFISAWLRRGAPFVPTAHSKVQALFGAGGLLRQGSGMTLPGGKAIASSHLVDLGSGGGTLVRAAVRKGGFGLATGFEINPALVAFSKLRSLQHGQKERFYLQSLWEADLGFADVVVVYGVPSIMTQLERKLVNELKPDCLVVSNVFSLPTSSGSSSGLQQVTERWVETGFLAPDNSSHLYVYRVIGAHEVRS